MTRWTLIRRAMLATTALAPFAIAPAAANPQGPAVVGGAATVSGVGTSSVTVHQATPRAIINWNSFNIGAGERTQFVQPGVNSIALNRVTGGLGPSQLYGTLSANGRVFVVNPDGIMIGRGAVIDTAGFLATTNDITNDNFMAGRYHFNIPGRPDASVVNEGRINAHSQGFAALVAPGVRNSGTITATYGKIGLAAGNSFSLDFYGDKLISLAVGDSIAATVKDVATGKPLTALVKNDGKLSANGGRVELTAAQARTVVDSVINNTGVIEARTIGHHNGKIVLGGPTAGTKIAGLPPQKVKVSGKLDVSNASGKGGTIQVTGEKIVVQAASFDASGTTGGGKVLIGGDTGGGASHWAVGTIPQAALEAGAVPNATSVSIDAATTINASVTSVGDGGKVIVWADGDTSFSGNIFARGGNAAGNGGFAEVSGKIFLTFDGKADLGAANGQRGTLLLDPLNGYIGSVAGPNIILASAIEQALAFGNVVVTTNNMTGSEAGDLFVNAPITWNNENNLLLTAYRDIVVNAQITNTFTGLPGGGNDQHQVILFADNTGTGVGTVLFGAGGGIKSSGEISIAFNPSVNPASSGVNPASYMNATENFLANVDLTGGGVLKPHFLVNTPADLQNVQNAPNANYVLGRDIDMSNFAGFIPINFNGTFTGIGRTISNLTITSTLPDVGLFGVLGANADVHEFDLFNFNVTGTATGGANVGAVAGTNNGLVENVWVGGAAVGATGPVSNVGGAIGHNFGKVERVNVWGFSSVVPAIGGVTFNVGGVVGFNDTGGTVRKSTAIGGILSNATGGDISLGLLVGYNNGLVTQGWTIGAINDSVFQIAASGGVIGRQGPAGTVSQVYSIPGSITGEVDTIGGVVGENNNPSPTSVTSAYWVTDLGGPADGIGPFGPGSTTGATGLTFAQLTSGTLPAGFSSSDWFAFPGVPPQLVPPNFFDPFAAIALIPDPNSSAPIDVRSLIPDEVLAVPNLVSLLERLERFAPGDALIRIIQTSLTTPGGPAGTRPGSQVPGTPPRSLAPPPAYIRANGLPSGLPPIGETRFNPSQVLVNFPTNVSQAEIARIAQQFGLTVVSSSNSSGGVAVQFQLGGQQNVRNTIRALERLRELGTVQPNYTYTLVQKPAEPAAAAAPIAATAHRGDPAQYMTGKLRLNEAHRVASGNNVSVAIIDSEVDPEHAELTGTFAGRFDATQSEAKPHSHGTAMAGAIVSRDRLLGVAPNARIMAVRAFSETQSTAESTTFTILKGIEWAVSQGARVINMSFAGPYDPSLERALKDAADKGVILIAASGNAGPKSPPLWPGADPNVIAVTATDSGDRLFRQANRGPYVSVASPGVEILAPAPQAAYQMSTGTSIATAHVSGVVALMLERDPTLTPRDVRLILESTAADLGPRGRDTQFGWGLVNPARALAMVDERLKNKKTSTAPAQQR